MPAIPNDIREALNSCQVALKKAKTFAHRDAINTYMRKLMEIAGLRTPQ